jgi:hypothetical protein
MPRQHARPAIIQSAKVIRPGVALLGFQRFPSGVVRLDYADGKSRMMNPPGAAIIETPATKGTEP